MPHFGCWTASSEFNPQVVIGAKLTEDDGTARDKVTRVQHLAEQLAELKDLKGFVAQIDGLKRISERDKQRMAGCQQALDRGFEAAKTCDRATHHFCAQLYGEEKVSGAWYRHTYSEMFGKRPRTDALPVLAPDQVVRRAASARATAGEPAACIAVA